MAIRPVFVTGLNGKLCDTENTEFEYFNGFARSQKQKCVRSLHQAFLRKNPGKNVLEISSYSEKEPGIRLSAFNLTLPMKSGKEVTVETAFQAGKIFEFGGPYEDLLEGTSRDAKKDSRLKNSGRIIGFTFEGERFETEPVTCFYNWLYINALQAHSDLADQLMEYDAFTDIVFNPEKSRNCQAEAAAVYVGLRKANLLEEALKDKNHFVTTVYKVLPEFIRTTDFSHAKGEELKTDIESAYEQKVERKRNTSSLPYSSQFKIGDELSHPLYGKGRIVSIEEMKNRAALTVLFSGGEKRIDEEWVLKNCKRV